MEHSMKMLLATVALGGVFAAPAFAQAPNTSKTNVPIGSTGGHVMTIVPESYDAKTNSGEVIDAGGRRRRSLSGFELRQLPPAGAGLAPQQGAGQPSGAAAAGGGRGVSDFVKQWESFNPHPFQDIGGTNIGYGTRARPGETSISEPEAAKRLNVELDRDRAAIEKMNPNLSEGSKKALTSLLYNLGGDTKRLKEHGMAAAIMASDPEAMKKAHLEFSHIHGPQGPVLPGLLRRRQDELKFYDEKGDRSSRLIDTVAPERETGSW